jgi:DNA replication and repair protein RecF
MYLRRLVLHNFRNLEHVEVIPDRRFNVLWGANAQGKTNILEGIYLLGHMKSFRGAPSTELIRRQMTVGRLLGEVVSGEVLTTIELTFNGQQKSARINGKSVANSSEFLGLFPTILFSPEEVGLVRGYPAGRRALLDRAVFQVDPSFLDRARAYQRCLQQRNRLLKEGCDPPQLSSWDENLIVTGARLRLDRIGYLRRLVPQLQNIYRQITAGKEEADLHYPVRAGTEEELRERFRRELEQTAVQERRLGRTLAGPHRDDPYFLVGGHSLRQYGSQGQQRSFMLAFKTAQIIDLEAKIGHQPVLLLDDMTGELDSQRQEFFFQFLRHRQGQVFVTATELQALCNKGFDDVRSFCVSGGNLQDVASQ